MAMLSIGFRLAANARRRASLPAIRAAASAALLLVALGATVATARAEDKEISARRAAESKSFTDRQIIDGFLKITFGAEFHTAGRIDRIRKFDGPVRVYIDSRARPDRTRQVSEVVADIRHRIANLDIAVTDDRKSANLVVSLVRDRDLTRTIATLYGLDRARKIQSTLEPQCLAGFRKDERYRIVHGEVIIVVDAGDFVFYDCAYEEILQALGPINDDETITWTMFHDDVQMGFFDVYDQYLLNLLYHARIRPGMTREEAHATAVDVLPEVRSFVTQTNGLTP